ncbi:MAG: hypothetical protein CMO16_05405 [Thaumarchaeota archaeon]|nr:hypothetical protein [Nitrososphaerota archaeon]
MKKIAVIIMGLTLMLATVALSDTSYAERQTSTNFNFSMSGCVNYGICGAEFIVGDIVEFKGTLTTHDGEPISGAEITVYKFLSKPELVPIVSGVTGIDGNIDLTWTAKLTPVEKTAYDVINKFQTETVTIFAQFDGDEQYTASTSKKKTATIMVNELKTIINSDKNLYRQGDSSLIYMAFLDNRDEFIDPDSLRVVLNNQEVQVEKKKVGSYVLTIPMLPKEHTQVFVIPVKEGYNIDNGFLTIIVDHLK